MQKRQAPVDLNSVKRGYTFCTRLNGKTARSGASTVEENEHPRASIAVTPPARYILRGTKVSCARGRLHLISALTSQFMSLDISFIPQSHECSDPDGPRSSFRCSLCSGSGSRWWCEHCRELRLDVHFYDGHIGVGLNISTRLFRGSVPISDRMRPRQFLNSLTSVFQRAEGARLPVCKSGRLPCTLYTR